MKLTVKYYLPVEAEIEITAEEYCNLRASYDSRPDIFPTGAINRQLPNYEEMSEANKKELENLWDRG